MTTTNRSQQQIMEQILSEHKHNQAGYREQALKLFPWVCGRCAREFSGKQVRELTVHHKDHNHDNNPSDGSNWELLCIYCHEQEHTRDVQEQYELEKPGAQSKPTLAHSPFAALLTQKFKK
jgi:hypothetical protein